LHPAGYTTYRSRQKPNLPESAPSCARGRRERLWFPSCSLLFAVCVPAWRGEGHLPAQLRALSWPGAVRGGDRGALCLCCARCCCLRGGEREAVEPRTGEVGGGCSGRLKDEEEEDGSACLRRGDRPQPFPEGLSFGRCGSGGARGEGKARFPAQPRPPSSRPWASRRG
jgi:hypothetical protein